MEEIAEISFEQVVSGYEKMIWRLSREIKERTNTAFELPELYNFGLFGLWKAYEGYDSNKGTKFSTYAYVTINGHILNAVNEEKAKDFTRSEFKRKEEVANLLWLKEENGWTWDETREYSNLTSEELREAIEWNKTPISIYSKTKRGESGDTVPVLAEHIPGDLGFEEKVIAKLAIKEVFSGLDELEQEIVRFRFLEGYNKKETCEILQIPSTSYRRKEEKLMKKIKDKKTYT